MGKLSKVSLYLICILLMINFVSAFGLKVINQSIYDTNKLAFQDLPFTFDLVNEEFFTFYNISIEDNNKVFFDKVPSLAPGQVIRVNAVIKSDENFNSTFKIIGYYWSQVGQSNQTNEIKITYDSGLDKCDFTIIKGDIVKWINKINTPIKLRNLNTNIDIVTISSNSNYTMNFDSPLSISYCAMMAGFCLPIMTPQYCTITVLNDNDYVNDPQKNGVLSLSINIIYNPTTISYIILEKNYNISVFESQDGVMSVKNTGSNIAKKVHLTGEWFSFSNNDFDILSGQTKAITYTIRPIVTKTNDTNKNYVKTLTISGNFDTISEDFSIFIPYTNLENTTSPSNFQSLLEMIIAWCKEHPQESFCRNESSVVYVYGNEGKTFNVSFGEEQVKGIFEYMFRTGEDLGILGNYIKEHFDSLGNDVSIQTSRTDDINTRLLKLEENQNKQSSSLLFAFIVGGILLLGGLVGAIIFIIKKDKIKEKTNRW